MTSHEQIVGQATHVTDQLAGELETLAATVRDHRPHCGIVPQDVCPGRSVAEYVESLPAEHVRRLLVVAVIIAAAGASPDRGVPK